MHFFFFFLVAQSVSVGVAALLRGVDAPSAKSALLLFVSSAGSSAVAQPLAWVRTIEELSGIAPPGRVSGVPQGCVPIWAPQATQSMAVVLSGPSRKQNPPFAFTILRAPAALKSAPATVASFAIRTVRWLWPFATFEGRTKVLNSLPPPS